MVVTMSTVERQSQKGLARMLNRIPHPVVGVERVVIADQVSGGNSCIVIVRADFIRRQHFANHQIVAFALIQRSHNPVSPAIQLRRTVADVINIASAVPVAVPPDIHPMPPPPFAMPLIVEQSVDNLFIRIR